MTLELTRAREVPVRRYIQILKFIFSKMLRYLNHLLILNLFLIGFILRIYFDLIRGFNLLLERLFFFFNNILSDNLNLIFDFNFKINLVSPGFCLTICSSLLWFVLFYSLPYLINKVRKRNIKIFNKILSNRPLFFIILLFLSLYIKTGTVYADPIQTEVIYVADDKDISVSGTLINYFKEIYGDNYTFIKSVLFSSSVLKRSDELFFNNPHLTAADTANNVIHNELGLAKIRNSQGDEFSFAYSLRRLFLEPENDQLSFRFNKLTPSGILSSPIITQLYSGNNPERLNTLNFSQKSGLETNLENRTTLIEHNSENGPLDELLDDPFLEVNLQKVAPSDLNYDAIVAILS